MKFSENLGYHCWRFTPASAENMKFSENLGYHCWRFTPASAENIGSLAQCCEAAPFHPRERGEHVVVRHVACAFHPRERGEY